MFLIIKVRRKVRSGTTIPVALARVMQHTICCLRMPRRFCKHGCLHTHKQIYTSTGPHAHTRTLTLIHTQKLTCTEWVPHMHTHTHTHTHTHINTRTHTHTHTHTHMHTQTLTCAEWVPHMALRQRPAHHRSPCSANDMLLLLQPPVCRQQHGGLTPLARQCASPL